MNGVWDGHENETEADVFCQHSVDLSAGECLDCINLYLSMLANSATPPAGA